MKTLSSPAPVAPGPEADSGIECGFKKIEPPVDYPSTSPSTIAKFNMQGWQDVGERLDALPSANVGSNTNGGANEDE